MEKNEILSIAIDTVKGVVDTKFSAKQTSDELRSAFIEMNGGSTKISPKTFHRGNELFELVQELVPVIIDEGIKTSTNPLFQMVDYRNLAAGDLAEFVVEADAHFVVSAVAGGVQNVRRQRISGGTTITVPTEAYIVRVYENLGRLLAGRIDFNKFVDGVAKAFENKIVEAIYAALSGLTATTYGLDATYVKSGSMTIENLMTLVAHVEAATGSKARIIGTKAALRKLGNQITYSAEQNSDLYNKGYLGMLNGIPCVAMDQAHKPGTSTFAIADDALWIVGADDKFVKVVNEGDGLMIDRDPTLNNDLTREYVYIQSFGVGVICAAKIGYWSSMVVA